MEEISYFIGCDPIIMEYLVRKIVLELCLKVNNYKFKSMSDPLLTTSSRHDVIYI